ncbi:MAG: hypothetical protein HY902_06425 [Deltaproteobacteria bacterium]|nr:hypothetical protein [Deltaproteobacteria bacterium]
MLHPVLLRALARTLPLLLLAPVLAFSAELPQIPDGLRAELAKVQHDPPPKELAANAHFVISDERAHHLYRESVQGLGGVLVGVGTDPNYLFAGWMKAELVLLVDYDQVVADLHGVYGVDLRNSATVEDFVAFWSPKQMPASLALIEKEAPDAATKKRWVAAYKLGRSQIHDKWLTTKKKYKAEKVPSLLSEPEQYNHVRKLAQTGRIWAWRGDLTAQNTMSGLSKALKSQNMEVMVFYITNAEAYFNYTPQARRNLRDLPYAEKSVLLRTQGRPEKLEEIADGHYSYYVQKGRDFVAWLERKNVGSAKPICWVRKPMGPQGLFSLGGPPAPKGKK